MEAIRIRAAVIICHDNQVLMVQHQKNGHRYWLLPGGGVEYGESAVDCAKRELTEETNLQVKVGQLAFVSETIAPDKSRHVLHLVFHAEITGGHLHVGDEPRLYAAEFVPIDQLANLTIHPPIAEFIVRAATDPNYRAEYLGVLWRD